MLVSMARVQIIGTRDKLDRTVQILHRAGVLQIEEKPPIIEAMLLDEAGSRQHYEITQLVARLDALLALLPKRMSNNLEAQYDAESARPTADVIADVQNAIAQIDAPAQAVARHHDELEADQVTLPRYTKTLRQLMPLAADLGPLRNYETVALLVERKFSAVIEMLREQLPAIAKDEFDLVARNIDAETTAAILVFPREHSAAIHTLLGRESITQVRLPDELTNVPFKEALAAIETRLAVIPQELQKIHAELDALANQWRTCLVVWSAVLHDRLQEIEIIERFGATQYTFVIVGWMPRKQISSLSDTLTREVGSSILLEELPLTEREREHAPVVFSNARPIKPFEFLVRLMALPRYGTIDPTPLMAIFLPIFFGMILGDVGYGALVLLGAIYFLRRSKPGGMKSLAAVIAYCSLWSIVFGVVYGECFGTLGEAIGMHVFFNRGESVIALFAFAIALGIVQVGLGFALGIYQAIKLHQRHELLDRVAKVIALIAIFMLVAIAANTLPKEMFAPSLTLLLVGTVLLMYTIGWIGLLLAPIEILGTVGNILSYLRLAAIGLSSVYLAMVANKLAGIFGNVIIGVIIAALFHALNLALGILSPTIQSLRLHYVEFFSKFFEGGGVDFSPFQRRGMV
ncbi:MAG: V-type ATP synthase subunit I [Chloroflexi bacterium]|nr:V-type ATP synthase subunit I [Chloroflexota bacterium]